MAFRNLSLCLATPNRATENKLILEILALNNGNMFCNVNIGDEIEMSSTWKSTLFRNAQCIWQ